MTDNNPNLEALEANLSDEDRAKIASGDYTLDPIFGVQPTTPRDADGNEIQDAPPSAQLSESEAAQGVPADVPTDVDVAPQVDPNTGQPLL